MKARITALFAVVVVALSLVAAASAAPHKSTVKGWDYYNGSSWSGIKPGGSSWSGLHKGSIKAWDRKFVSAQK